MKARVLDRADVLKIVDLLRRQGYEVIAPFRGRGRDTFFDTVTDQNRDQIQIHLPNPYYPPKRYVFPHIERLLKIERNNGGLRVEPTYETPKRAIFGIRSCDIAGIFHLDRFYLGREFRDIYYENRRKNLLLINVACTDPEVDIGEECFCVCSDTGPAARGHFDLQLMDLDDEFLAVAGTPAGEAMFADPIFRKGTDGACGEAPGDSGRRQEALQARYHELVFCRHRRRHTRPNSGKNLGGDRQPLPGMWRLHLCLPGLHLFHHDRSPGRAERNRTGADLGFLRFWRFHAHGGGFQSAQGGA